MIHTRIAPSSLRSVALSVSLLACDAKYGGSDDDNKSDRGVDASVDASTDGPHDGIPSNDPYIVLAAGDIASSEPRDTDTSNLVLGLPGTVLILGDNAYQSGTNAEYMSFYEPTWG